MARTFATPQPLVWAVPEQPGREVEAVRDRYASDEAEALDGKFWRNLLHEVGPLTDATGEVA
jgi:hypothetical protein